MKFEKGSDTILSSREWKTAHLQRKGIKLASKSVATAQTVEANGFRGKMISSLWPYNYRLSTKDPFRQRLFEGALQAKWKRNLQKRKAWCGRNSGTSPAWCPNRKSQLGSSPDPESWWSDTGTSTNSVIKNPVVVRLWKRRGTVKRFFEWEKRQNKRQPGKRKAEQGVVVQKGLRPAAMQWLTCLRNWHVSGKSILHASDPGFVSFFFRQPRFCD